MRQTQTQATPPTLSNLRLTPTAFRAARSGASIARARIGTTVSYQDSVIAKTTFTVDRALPGVIEGTTALHRRAVRDGESNAARATRR